MKKSFLITIILCLVLFGSQAQNYSKGNFLLNMDLEITRLNPPHEIVVENWEGTHLNTSLYYIFYKNRVAAVSSGIHSTYFRHQPQDGKNYGTLALAIPINIHFSLLPNVDPYLGYRMGYYFDGYNPADETIVGYYQGSFSELYVGVKYLLLPRLSVYAELSATQLNLSGGLSLKF